MMVKKLISILMFVAVLGSGTVAFAGQTVECAPALRRAKGMVINGTRTILSNNLVGVISDSKTGKGIPGVPVTDGYTFTVTDKNGVYQLAADDRCRNVYYKIGRAHV